jgi:DNA-binding PadR family transcriptional regulator
MSVPTPDHLLLGLLAMGDQHGYQLLEQLQTTPALARAWHISPSQIYAVLKRLERDALIAGRMLASESGPPRVQYTLTDVGRARMLAWLHEAHPSASIRRVRVDFISRVYIARALALPVGGIIARQRDSCLGERERLLRDLALAPTDMERMTLSFVVEQLDAALRWLDRCEAILIPS